MEKFLLCAFLTYDELDIVDEKDMSYISFTTA